MAYALVNHIGAASSNGGTFTTSAIDTTGADFLVVCLSDQDGSTTITDSKGNTWHLAVGPTGSGPKNSIFYAWNATVGTGHTFTATGSKFQAVSVMAFSGSQTGSDPKDQTNSATAAGASSLQTGSITPGSNNELIISGASQNSSSNTLAVDSSLTIRDQGLQVGGQHYGYAGAYLIQGTAAAINPTWTAASTNITGLTIASFKAAAGAAPVPPQPHIYTRALHRAANW
jgi:hypothetical protein